MIFSIITAIAAITQTQSVRYLGLKMIDCRPQALKYNAGFVDYYNASGISSQRHVDEEICMFCSGLGRESRSLSVRVSDFSALIEFTANKTLT
jgi:hypothetical protein